MPKHSAGDATIKFGERLKERREQLGMEKTELGKRANISHTAIWSYEEGRQSPNVEVLTKLADALECTVDYLFGRTNLPNYVLISGEQLPAELRDKHVDAVEILRSQVQEDGGISQASQREVLRIVSEAKLLRYSKPRQSTPDLSKEPPK